MQKQLGACSFLFYIAKSVGFLLTNNYMSMKHLLFVCVVVCMFNVASAQSIARSAITSGGASTSITDNTISFSIGQSVVSTTQSGNIVLTQGFQQSDQKSSTGTIDLLSEGVYTVFPNPSNGTFSVELDANSTIEGVIEIYNLIGQKLKSKVLNPSQYHFVDFNLVGVTAGVHFITMKSKEGQTLFTQNILIQD